MLYTYIYAWYSSFYKKYLEKVIFHFHLVRTKNWIQAQLDSVFQEDNVVCSINVYKKAKHYRQECTST